MTALLEHLEERRSGGRKLLVPYVMGAIPDRTTFADAYRSVLAGADVVEVGLPYSDPLMDGPVIASAGERVLRTGAGPLDVLGLVEELPRDVPRVVMTYYNPIHHLGEAAFCDRCVAAGISGLIIPDIPLEESESLRAAAEERDLAWIPLVAPTSSDQRIEAIAATATGFVYAVSTLGVTGVRTGQLSERASALVERVRRATDLPVCIGIGVSDAEQAKEATRAADGVVVGSALVKALLEEGFEAARNLMGELRAALDA